MRVPKGSVENRRHRVCLSSLPRTAAMEMTGISVLASDFACAAYAESHLHRAEDSTAFVEQTLQIGEYAMVAILLELERTCALKPFHSFEHSLVAQNNFEMLQMLQLGHLHNHVATAKAERVHVVY